MLQGCIRTLGLRVPSSASSGAGASKNLTHSRVTWQLKVHQICVPKKLVQPEDERQTSSDHKPLNKHLKREDVHQNHQATKCHRFSLHFLSILVQAAAIEQFLADQLSHPLDPKVQAFQGTTDASNDLKVKNQHLRGCLVNPCVDPFNL